MAAMKSSERYFEFSLLDGAALSGSSVSKFLSAIKQISGAPFVLATGVEGALNPTSHLTEGVFPIASFMQKVGKAAQYDWAFFHYYETLASASLALDSGSDLSRIEQSLITVRLADSAYFFAYFKSSKFARSLSAEFPAAAISRLPLDKVVVPY